MTSGWSADFLQGTSGAWQQQHLQREQVAARLALLREQEERVEAELQRCQASLREQLCAQEASRFPPGGGPPLSRPLPGATVDSPAFCAAPGVPLSVPAALSPSHGLAPMPPNLFAPTKAPVTVGNSSFSPSQPLLQSYAVEALAASGFSRGPSPAREVLRGCAAESPPEARSLPLLGASAVSAEGLATPQAPPGAEDEAELRGLHSAETFGANAQAALEHRSLQLLQEKERLREMQQQQEQLLEELQQQQQQRQQQLLLQLQPPEGLHCGPAGKQALRQFFEQAYMLSRPSAAPAAGSLSPASVALSVCGRSRSVARAKGPAMSPSTPEDLPPSAVVPSLLPQVAPAAGYASDSPALHPPPGGAPSSAAVSSAFLASAAAPSAAASSRSASSPPLLSNVSPALVVCRRWQATQGLRDARAAALVSLLRAMGVKRNATYRGVFESALRPKLLLRAAKLRAVVRRFFDGRRTPGAGRPAGAGDGGADEDVDLARLKAVVVPHLGAEGEAVWRDWALGMREGKKARLSGGARRPPTGAGGASETAKAAGGTRDGGGAGTAAGRATAVATPASSGLRRRSGRRVAGDDGEAEADARSRRGSLVRSGLGKTDDDGGGLLLNSAEDDGLAGGSAGDEDLPPERLREGHEALRAIQMLYSAVGRLAPMFQVRPLQPILAAVIEALQPLPLPPAVLKMVLDDTPAARDFYKIAHTRTKHLIWVKQPWKFFSEVSADLDACVAVLNTMAVPQSAAETTGAVRAALTSPSYLRLHQAPSRQLASASPEIPSPSALLQQHVQKLLDLVDGNPAIYNLLTLVIRLKFILSLLPPRSYVIDLRNNQQPYQQSPGDTQAAGGATPHLVGASPSPPLLLAAGGEKGWGRAAGGHYIPIVPVARDLASSSSQMVPALRGASSAAAGRQAPPSPSPDRQASPAVFAAARSSSAAIARTVSGESTGQSADPCVPPTKPEPSLARSGAPAPAAASAPAEGTFLGSAGSTQKPASDVGLYSERSRGTPDGGAASKADGGLPPDGGGGRDSAAPFTRDLAGDAERSASAVRRAAAEGGAVVLAPSQEAAVTAASGVSRASLISRAWSQAECQWGQLRCLLAVGYRDKFNCDDAEMRTVDTCWSVILLVSEVIRSGTNSMESARRRDELLKSSSKSPFATAAGGEASAEKAVHIRSSNDLLDVCIALMHPLFLQAVAESLALSFYRPDFHPLIFRSQERVWRAFAVLGLSAPYVGLTKFILESRPSPALAPPVAPTPPLSPSSPMPTVPSHLPSGGFEPPFSLPTTPAASVLAAGASGGAEAAWRAPASPAACPSPSLRVAARAAEVASPAERRADAEAAAAPGYPEPVASEETQSEGAGSMDSVRSAGRASSSARTAKPDAVANAADPPREGPSEKAAAAGGTLLPVGPIELSSHVAAGGSVSGESSPSLPAERGPVGFPPWPPSAASGLCAGWGGRPLLPPPLPHAGGWPRQQLKRGSASVEASGAKSLSADERQQKRRKAGGGVDIPLAKLVAYAAGSSAAFPSGSAPPPGPAAGPEAPAFANAGGSALSSSVAPVALLRGANGRACEMFRCSLADLRSTHSFLSAYLPRFHTGLYAQCTQSLQAFFDLARAAATAAACATGGDQSCSLVAAEAVAAALSGSDCAGVPSSASAFWISDDGDSATPFSTATRAKDGAPAGAGAHAGAAPQTEVLSGLGETPLSPSLAPQVARLKERLRALARDAAGAWPPSLGFSEPPPAGDATPQELKHHDAVLPLASLAATVAALSLPQAGAGAGEPPATDAGGLEPARRRGESEGAGRVEQAEEGRRAADVPARASQTQGAGSEESGERDKGAEPSASPPTGTPGSRGGPAGPPVASPARPPSACASGAQAPRGSGADLAGAAATAGPGGLAAFCAKLRAAVQHCGDDGVCRRLLVAGRTEIVLARLILTSLLPLTAKSEAFRALQHGVLRRVAHQAQALLLLSSAPEEFVKDSETTFAGESSDDGEREGPGARGAGAKDPRRPRRNFRALSLAEVDWQFLMTLRTFVRLASTQQEGVSRFANALDGGGPTEGAALGVFQPAVLAEMTKLLSLLAERHALFLQLSVDLLRVPSVTRAVGARAPTLLMHAWKLGKRQFSNKPASVESLMFARSFGEAARLSRL
ncbi:hypothetical protein BESB_072230 [Besnoitia besnoiti]|uniref:Uncharacterized protein n=1 Tax=Besnoitia besnoiti TaxID=94643 RepID=A0A2A9MCN3_BESBE|nr:uncharacterized protein BESB_072230 [Besnoitia besnoiti]PFH34071.1 hypothetical protein BESB_072230 [Besnoitia besnoiti]